MAIERKASMRAIIGMTVKKIIVFVEVFFFSALEHFVRHLNSPTFMRTNFLDGILKMTRHENIEKDRVKLNRKST